MTEVLTGGRTRVAVLAPDLVSGAGVMSVLRCRTELDLVSARSLAEGSGEYGRPDVVVVVADHVDGATLQRITSVRRAGTRVVLLAKDIDGPDVLDTVNAGASAIVRRAEATDERLSEAIRVAAAGDGSLPRDVVTHLFEQVDQGGSSSANPGLTHRELRILRLLADGLSTLEIAREMAYSERTIKQAVHAITTRLKLRNRSHAVAYAVRKGLI
jgi:DNA-binding NarL/FixJ family response regulator